MHGVMHVVVTGELDNISSFAERINACYRMYLGTTHGAYGDLFYDNLHYEWHVEGKEKAKRGRKKAAQEGS